MIFFIQHIKVEFTCLNRTKQLDRNIYQAKANGTTPY